LEYFPVFLSADELLERIATGAGPAEAREDAAALGICVS